jgi:hypothetical protein
MAAASSVMDVTPFSPESPLGFFPLERALEVKRSFHRGVLELLIDGVHMDQTSRFKKFLEMVL